MAGSKVEEYRAWMASLVDMASQPLEIPDAPEGIDVKAVMSAPPDDEILKVDMAASRSEDLGWPEFSDEERGYNGLPQVGEIRLSDSYVTAADPMKMPQFMMKMSAPVEAKVSSDDNMKAYTMITLYGIRLYEEPAGGDSWSPELIGFKTVFISDKKYWVEGDRLLKLVAALMENHVDYVAMR